MESDIFKNNLNIEGDRSLDSPEADEPRLITVCLVLILIYMRIGIDARFYGPIGKGLGHTQEVVDIIKSIGAG